MSAPRPDHDLHQRYLVLAATAAAVALTAAALPAAHFAAHVASRPIHLTRRQSKAAATSSVFSDDHLAAALATAATLDQSSRAHSDRQR